MKNRLIWGSVILVAILALVITLMNVGEKERNDFLSGFLHKNPKTPSQTQTGPSEDEIKNLPESSAIKQAIIKAKIQEQRERMEEKKREDAAKIRKATEEIGKKYGVRYLEDGFDRLSRYFNFNVKGYDYLPVGTTGVKNPAYPHCIRDQWSKDDIRYSSECVYETFLLERLSKNIQLQDALFAAKTNNVKIVLTMNRFRIDTRIILIDINADDQTIIDYLTKNSEVIKKK